jgi:hypothetical protein
MTFVGDRDNPRRKLIRMPISGGIQIEISDVAALSEIHCRFSRAHICILSEESGGQTTFSLFDPFKGRVREVSKVDEVNLNWSLSPDGSSIAMVKELSDCVRLLDIKSNKFRIIYPNPRQNGLQDVAWSSNGMGTHTGF